MFKRLLTPSKIRSFFLFGPRSTGKSTLLRQLFSESEALWIDLLDPEAESLFSQSPARLTALLAQEQKKQNQRKWIVIDEIQKVPALLSVVHSFIHKKQFLFAMTGSSPRKLKRGAANLLGGRASWFELSALTYHELGDSFSLDVVLQWGSLPEIFELEEKERTRFLKAYCHLYLKEEVVAEQLVRKVQPFRNFLECVALQNAQIINYSQFAKDCQVDIATIQAYFEILEDTLVGFLLPPFHTSIRKRQRVNPKFYFFDTGVTRALAGSLEGGLTPKTFSYGKCFEQWVVTEIYRLIKAYEKEWKLSYLTTKDGAEIDLLIDLGSTSNQHRRWAIEIKSSSQVDEQEVLKFERLAQDVPHAHLLFLSQDPVSQKYGSVECLFWKEALDRLFPLQDL